MSEFIVHNSGECSDGPKSGAVQLKEFIVRWEYNGDGKILVSLNNENDKLIQSIEHVKSKI
jgi:hypothetical protein